MKDYILLLILLALLPLIGKAQSDRYMQAMTEIAIAVDTVRSAASMTELDNRLQRIEQAEPKQWLPAYYRAVVQVGLASTAMDGRQIEQVKLHAKTAQEALDRAMERSPDNSENMVVQARIYMIYLSLDPMGNGPQYAGLVHESLDRAITLDADNPRAWMVRGMMVLYTPPMFGGGAEAALPHLEKAQQLYMDIEPSDPVTPRWGKDVLDFLLGAAGKSGKTE